MELFRLSIQQLSERLQRKEVSSEEVTKAYLERIGQVEDDIKAFITITDEHAIQQARAVDGKRKRGDVLSPLAGIPVAVTDNISTKGIRTTCASDILHNYIPPFSAGVVERLTEAGAVLIGKCNMDEFDMGSSTENSTFFSSRNPFDPERVPGGSGGGAAAAVAAGGAAFGIGSDIAGSVRLPAAFCGVAGMKPTNGCVSRYGLISPVSSIGQIGPFARDMHDLALIMRVICGHDERDSASVSAAVPDFTDSLANGVKGLRIGLPNEYVTDVNPEIAAKLREAARVLEAAGAVCEETSLPHTGYALPAFLVISSAEASSNLARYDGVRHGLRVDAEDVSTMFRKTRSQGFGAEVKRRILLGTFALSTGRYDAYYGKALKVRTLVKQDFERAFANFDCLLTPTSPTTAFRAGEKADVSLAMYHSDRLTVAANLAGVPAMSLPFGMVDGLPVGLQLIARPFDDGTLLRVGYTLEQNTDQTRLIPGLAR